MDEPCPACLGPGHPDHLPRRAIGEAGGIANQFTGDGVMARFGIDTGPDEASRRARRAAADMVASVAQPSRRLEHELPSPLRLGIGIHVGPAVGHMGHGASVHLTAVGDTVHVAARLEELTKTYRCELVISEPVTVRAGADTAAYPRHELTLRNRREPLAIHVVGDARPLAAALAPAAGGAPGTQEG